MKDGGEKDPLKLDMDFSEALHRFIQTDPIELSDTAKVARAAKARALERSKQTDAKADSAVAGASQEKVGKPKREPPKRPPQATLG